MGKNNSILQQFLELNGKIERLSSQVNSAKNALNSSDIFKYETQLEKVLKNAEKIILKLREIANYSLKVNNNPLAYGRIMGDISSQIYNISIKRNDDTYRICLPCTLPHYGSPNKSILTQPLNDAFKKHNKENKIIRLNSAIIVFINHTSNKNLNYVRDNDNYDYKQIINSIAFWLLPDDSFKCCNTFNLTVTGEEDFSEIFVIPSEKFTDFFEKNIKNNI